MTQTIDTTEGTAEVSSATVRETLVAEYGDDFARRIAHVADVVNTYRTEGADVLVFNLARSGDVYGYDEPIEISNYRTLLEAWEPDYDVFTRTYSNVDTIGLRLDSPAPADLVEVIDALSDYPILDEQCWSDVEQEIIGEHWQSYGRSDVLGAVAEAINAEDLTPNAEEIVYRLVWDGLLDYGYGGGYPSMIDSSAVDFGAREVSQYIADNLGTVIELSRWHSDEPDVLDLTVANLIAR